MISHYHFESAKKRQTKKNSIASINDLAFQNVDKTFKLQLNIDFKVQNLRLQKKENKLLITGTYECDFHIPIITKKTMKFNREVDLPDNVDKSRISSYIISEEYYNVLTIEAPIISRINNSTVPISIIRPQNTDSVRRSSSRISNINNVISDLPVNENNSSVLRYEFDLGEYRPEDIDICVEDGKRLIITAVKRNFDYHNYGIFNECKLGLII